MSDWVALHNRLVKNWKHRVKWAKHQKIQCFRIYDRDIPAFPLIIDWYQGHVHLQEHDTHWQQTESEHITWLQQVKDIVKEVLQTEEAYLHCKLRFRQRAHRQYQKTDKPGQDFVVEEQEHRFWVNLDAYIDTGLFLDHRPTRRWVAQQAAGKRFLNLFCYTGSFTVYAGVAGAIYSESVDLSRTYLEWAKRNLLLNYLNVQQHKLVCADVFTYLSEAQRLKSQFDLIVLDPPSFSNSAKMHGVLNIQRDHTWLIKSCLYLLSEGGILYFSTNLRGFVLDSEWETSAENMTYSSIPDDFRNKKIHQCWRFVKPI